MQRRSVALEVLDSIHIGMEYIRTIQYASRLMGTALNKIIVISIDTGYHIPAKWLALKEIHEH
jgi:hypothetical protein